MVDWLSSMNGCAAGSTFWTYEHPSCALNETRKTGSRYTIKFPSVIGRKPNAAQCTIVPRFNQLSNDGEHFSQWVLHLQKSTAEC